MALVFFDSFDHYQTADITTKWTSLQLTPTITTGGRTHQCLECSGEGVYKGLTAQTTYIVGAAFKPSSLSQNRIIFEFRSNANRECQVCLETSGALSVYRAGLAGTLGGGTSGTQLGPSSDSLLSVDVWAYVECQMTLSNTAAAWTIAVNGVTALSESGASGYDNVRDTASITSIGVGGAALIDDVYICDTTGSVNNTLLGDSTAEAIFPQTDAVAAGTHEDFTCLTDSDQGAMVDESATDFPDGDTTYIYSSTDTHRSTFNYPDITPTSATIHGVQVNISAKKSDTGTRTYTSAIRSGGSDYDGETSLSKTVAPSDSAYAYGVFVHEVNPDTSTAWTVSGVNAAEFGVLITD